MNRNWVLTFYKSDNSISKKFLIADRTESEADTESMRYIENFRITLDWTLTPATGEDMILPELD